jgi:purine-binding chemotaxis protein CheW
VARQLVLFRLAGRSFGIELDPVREIVPFRRATRLPGTSARVAGLMNVHGTIVTVIDLAAQLGTSTAPHAGGSVVLVEQGSKLVGVAVDEVLDVRRAADLELGADADAVPDGGAVRAFGRLDGEVIALLDIHDIISQVLA